MLARCEETNLVLNWGKVRFMVKEGIVLGHKISSAGIKVDKAKVNVIAKLPYPTNIKGIRNHSALKYLFSKQDAKPRLIRLENPELEELDEEAIRDSFPDEHLMAIYAKEPEKDPWYADYANFLVSKVMPRDLTYHLRKKFLSDLKHYIWDEPYLFKSSRWNYKEMYVWILLATISSKMPQNMFGNVMHAREPKTSPLAIKCPSPTSSLAKYSIFRVLISWDPFLFREIISTSWWQ
ncbi:hypothetical protein Tco_1435768 [Tanacetum coccineum]